jgi:hypothetical protein
MIIIYGLFLSVPASHPPRITGRSGRTHGARTVRMPARNEMRIMAIIERWFRGYFVKMYYLSYFCNIDCKIGVSFLTRSFCILRE